MIPRWKKRGRSGGSRLRPDIRDVLVDENTDYLVDETGAGLLAALASTTQALRDERGLTLIDENSNALIAL